MGKSSEYNHYMQRIDAPGYNILDIEEEFPGLLYSKAEGMNAIGKAMNVYTESYADSDDVRYYLPENDADYANESTTINMTFLVVGTADRRQDTMDAFIDYVRKGVHRYWDDARNREFDFIIVDEISISDERWHGNNPYVELTIPMKNLNGKTRKHN